MKSEIDRGNPQSSLLPDRSGPKNVFEYNRIAWDAQVDKGDRWTIPVSSQQIQQAQAGNWQIVLTPQKPVPREWFGQLAGANLLCLAGAGGQQAPILAAAGANVTVFDSSAKQLFQDALVAARDGLKIRTIQGDMTCMMVLDDASFDIIVHPCANCFVREIQPIWNHAFRLLKAGGTLLSGFCNPVSFLFDQQLARKGVLTVTHAIPFSDLESISDEERDEHMDRCEPLCFGHTLEDQIGGQIRAGFSITGFYEDIESPQSDPVSKYIARFAATRAIKPIA